MWRDMDINLVTIKDRTVQCGVCHPRVTIFYMVNGGGEPQEWSILTSRVKCWRGELDNCAVHNTTNSLPEGRIINRVNGRSFKLHLSEAFIEQTDLFKWSRSFRRGLPEDQRGDHRRIIRDQQHMKLNINHDRLKTSPDIVQTKLVSPD